MISVHYKNMGFLINSIWFSDNIRMNCYNKNADIIHLHALTELSNKNNYYWIQFSLITNLKNDELSKSYNKNYRNEIRKAINSNVSCRMYDSHDLKKMKNRIKLFEQDYIEFARLKGLKTKFNICAILTYLESNNLYLSVAESEGIVLAQHFYIADDKNTRLLYSVSNFRSNLENKKLIGNSNKYLHDYDMNFFKNKELEYYDWGGIASPDEPNGIDKFKMRFGGELVKYYNVLIGTSLKGKILILLHQFIKYVARGK